MEVMDAMRARHSVRQYKDEPIADNIRARLQQEVDRLNAESGLHMQLFFDEPGCFKAGQAHYGQFVNCRNYLAIVGRRAPDLDEKSGYYGEKIVLLAQSLGLNSCWVALTHSKSLAVINAEEKLVIIVALGYGQTQGKAHKSKPIEQLCSAGGEMPEWFRRGMEGAMLAPTAINQQKFKIIWKDGKLTAKAGIGPVSRVDLGIVKNDFELASGHKFDR